MTAFAPIAFEHLPEQATIVARREYLLRAVACDLPLLVVPLQGCKRLRQGQTWEECRAGQFVMLHQAQYLDVENRPDADAAYRALIVAFPWHLLDMARSLLARRPQVQPAACALSRGELQSLEAALQLYLACDPADSPATEHAALGLLLALARAGHDAFRLARNPSLAARARLMIAAAPARDWKSADLEEAFCISGATLRRQLQEEGTSFRALLQEARLHHGLTLLQTSARPLKSVAAACGYRSPTSFRRAFAERFGQEPAAVAGY